MNDIEFKNLASALIMAIVTFILSFAYVLPNFAVFAEPCQQNACLTGCLMEVQQQGSCYCLSWACYAAGIAEKVFK